jgi:chemotaxis protein methyltransferase CheR
MIEILCDEQLVYLNNKIKDTYPFDFSNYALASFGRRVQRVMMLFDIDSAEKLVEKIISDTDFFENFVEEITVNTTEMFRDPELWTVLRNELLPSLAKNEIIRIWHAGCSSGQEVFSMIILLNELGIESRTKIFATDISNEILKSAKSGKISHKEQKINEENYQKSGGNLNFYSYFDKIDKDYFFKKDLLTNVLFKQHDLVLNDAFSKFDLILCRNVLIYFNKELQDNVYKLFSKSLFKNGLLAIGRKESMIYSPMFKFFKEVKPEERIYQLISTIK